MGTHHNGKLIEFSSKSLRQNALRFRPQDYVILSASGGMERLETYWSNGNYSTEQKQSQPIEKEIRDVLENQLRIIKRVDDLQEHMLTPEQMRKIANSTKSNIEKVLFKRPSISWKKLNASTSPLIGQMRDRAEHVHQMCKDRLNLDNRLENNIIYHQREWFEHGPTAIVPSYNLLVSVPEKCGTEYWFLLFEFLNFPQETFPKGKEKFKKGTNDFKNIQRLHMIPMLYSITGGRQSVKNDGVTMAVVRHPFLRLYSAYTGFFESPSGRDIGFGKYWIKSSPDFGWNKLIGKMSFKQFLDGILKHMAAVKSDKRWTNAGEAHINPMFGILNPCHYPFQYYLKVENLSAESKELLTTLQIEVPDDYMIQSHASSKVRKTPDEIFKSAYSGIDSKTMEKLYSYFKKDFEFFGYTVDIHNLTISY